MTPLLLCQAHPNVRGWFLFSHLCHTAPQPRQRYSRIVSKRLFFQRRVLLATSAAGLLQRGQFNSLNREWSYAERKNNGLENGMIQSNAAANIRCQFRLDFCAGLLAVSIKTTLSLKQYHRCSSSSSNIDWPHLSHLGICKSNDFLSFELSGINLTPATLFCCVCVSW